VVRGLVSTVGGSDGGGVGNVVEDSLVPVGVPEVGGQVAGVGGAIHNGSEAGDGLGSVVVGSTGLTELLVVSLGDLLDLVVGTGSVHDLTELVTSQKLATGITEDPHGGAVLRVIRVTAVKLEIDLVVGSNEVVAEPVGGEVLQIRVEVVSEVALDSIVDGEDGTGEGAAVPLVVGDKLLSQDNLVVVDRADGGSNGGGGHTDEVPRLGALDGGGGVIVVIDELIPRGLSGDVRVRKVKSLLHLSDLMIVVDLELEEVDNVGAARLQEIFIIIIELSSQNEAVDPLTARFVTEVRAFRPEVNVTISPPEVLLLVGRLQVPPITTEVPVSIRETVGVAKGTLTHAPSEVFGLIDGLLRNNNSNKHGQQKCLDHHKTLVLFLVFFLCSLSILFFYIFFSLFFF